MTVTEEAVRPRRRSGVRSWSIAVVAAGAVLIPAAPALADHMPGMNGTMCPHASGEGPDSLAAAGPNESAGPARAPSEQPITTPAAASPAPASAPAPAAKPVNDTSRPASQVTRPARTQVPVQQPATRVAQSEPAEAVARTAEPVAARTPVRTTVAKPVKAGKPKAKRSAPRAGRATRPAFERRFNGLEPRVSRGSALPEPVAQAREQVAPGTPAPSAPLLLVLGLATLAAVAGVIVVGRRGRGTGEVASTHPTRPPVAPAYADLSVEAELREILAEADARALLGDRPDDRASPERVPAAQP